MLFADSIPDGRGGFSVKPKKPVREVAPKDAARVIGVSMRLLRTIAAESSIIKWRWSSPRRGKRIFDLDSLLKYRAASADPEFGDHPHEE